METVSKSRFKPRVLECFRGVQKTGKPLVITEYGKPVLMIAPYDEDAAETLEELRGSVLRYTDPLEPVGLADWEVIE